MVICTREMVAHSEQHGFRMWFGGNRQDLLMGFGGKETLKIVAWLFICTKGWIEEIRGGKSLGGMGSQEGLESRQKAWSGVLGEI